MTRCYRCKQTKDKGDLLGMNIFDATTGTHIVTRWYCLFCAKVIGIIDTDMLRLSQ